MNPVAFVRRWLPKALLTAVVLTGGGAFALYKTRVDVPALRTARLYALMDSAAVRVAEAKQRVVGRHGPGGPEHGEGPRAEAHKVVVTRPESKDVVITQQYVCQIHSQRHIDVCALEGGYLEEVAVREGQAVKAGDTMFKIVSTLYQAKLDAELAEAQLAQLEFNNTRKLFEQKVVSENEVALLQAKLTKAQAEAKLAGAELNFATIKAPFDGIVDRLHEQLGSLIGEGDMLTTLSDNSVMWVYFNLPEARYLEYMAARDDHGDRGANDEADDDDEGDDDEGDDDGDEDERIELVLANGEKFPHTGTIGAIEANFNNETGNIPFRADFPNPEGLLRHGQTGTVVIRRELKDAVVIPQRATFEILAKRYAYVVDGHGVVHQREIVIRDEMDDIFVIEEGLAVGDKIVLEGVRQVRDGDEVEYEFLEPEAALDHLKYHAE